LQEQLWTRDKRLLRLPQEDCCQALSVPPSRKYESEGGPGIQDIAALLKGSDTRKPIKKPCSTTIEELLDAGASKIDGTLRQLPKDFPEATATSIAEAAKRRLAQFLPL
jgi:hypothetical protein